MVAHQICGKRNPNPSILWGGVGEGKFSRLVKIPSNRRSDRSPNGRFIHIVQADDDQAGAAHFAGSPGAVEILVDPGADALDQKAHRLSRYIGKALQPENVMRGNDRLQLFDETGWIGNRAQFDEETVEFVMAVLLAGLVFHLVMGLAVGDIAFGADAKAEQDGGGNLAVLGLDHRRLAAGA